MDKQVFRINVEFGKNYSASFNALMLDADDNATSYARVDSDGVINNGGVLRIDDEKGKAALLYDIFSVVVDIDTKKETDGILQLTCHNSLFSQIDVYIAEYSTWMEKGPSLFRSQD